LLIAAIGVWWLVYFNLRSICDLFRSSVPAPAYYAPLPHEAHGPTSIPNVPSKPSSGLFSSPPHVPAAIKIIARFLLIGAVLCLPLVLLPIPAFILGFIVPVKAAHFLFLGILVIAAGAGYGLLKLRNFARMATIAFVVFGLINSAISLLPWSQNRLREYMAQFVAHFTAMLPTFPGQPAPVYNYPTSTIVFNVLLGIAINIYVLWLLTAIAPHSTRPRPCRIRSHLTVGLTPPDTVPTPSPSGSVRQAQPSQHRPAQPNRTAHLHKTHTPMDYRAQDAIRSLSD